MKIVKNFVKCFILFFCVFVLCGEVKANTYQDINVNNTYSGETAYGNDIYYYFEISEAGILEASVKRTNAAKDPIFLYLYNVDDMNIRLASEKGAISKYLEKGKYVAIVYWTDCADGNPTISYDFSINFTAKSGSSNSSMASALTMTPGSTYSETIYGTGISNGLWYKVEVAKESMIVIGNPGVGFLAKLYSSYDLNNPLMTMSDDFNNKHSFMTVSAGTYYMSIEAKYGAESKFNIDMDVVAKPQPLTIKEKVDDKTGKWSLSWDNVDDSYCYRVYEKSNDAWKLISSTAPIERYKYYEYAINGCSIEGGAIYEGGSKEFSVVAVAVPSIDTSGDYYYSEIVMPGDIEAGKIILERGKSENQSTNDANTSSNESGNKFVDQMATYGFKNVKIKQKCKFKTSNYYDTGITKGTFFFSNYKRKSYDSKYDTVQITYNFKSPKKKYNGGIYVLASVKDAYTYTEAVYNIMDNDSFTLEYNGGVYDCESTLEVKKNSWNKVGTAYIIKCVRTVKIPKGYDGVRFYACGLKYRLDEYNVMKNLSQNFDSVFVFKADK